MAGDPKKDTSAKKPADDAEEDEAAPPPLATGLERFGTATKESRDAAKWLVGGFGAIGAALVAGTQMSSIGALEDPVRLVVAITAAAIGLMAAATGAAVTMWVLLPGYLTLSAIAKAEQRGPRSTDFAYFGDVVTESPDVGEGYATSVAGANGLLARLQKALADRAAAYSAYLDAYGRRAEDVPTKERAFEVAEERASELARVGYGVVNAASYRRVNRGTRPWVIAIILLALVIGVSVGVFAWAANPKQADQADKAAAGLSLRGVVLADVDLSGRDLTTVDFQGATLTNVILRGSKLDATKLKSVTWSNVTCPDGANSGEGSCLEHLD